MEELRKKFREFPSFPWKNHNLEVIRFFRSSQVHKNASKSYLKVLETSILIKTPSCIEGQNFSNVPKFAVVPSGKGGEGS